MAKGTREKILKAALELFSQKGYEGINIRELSASLGLVKSAVYKHYQSKEELWNALLDHMNAYYEEHFGSKVLLPPVPSSLQGLLEMTMRLVDFTIHDDMLIKTRRLLSIEQFRDDRARALSFKYFKTALTEMFTPHFRQHDGKGAAAPGGPHHDSFFIYHDDQRAHPPV